MAKTNRSKSAGNPPEVENPPVFVVDLPWQIEPEWVQAWGPLLAGFPIELVYTGFRPADDGSSKAIVMKARYVFDPGSFVEDDSRKQMRYIPRLPSEYYVDVVWGKTKGRWETSKFRDGRLVATATGLTFRQAMIQTLLIGLQPD